MSQRMNHLAVAPGGAKALGTVYGYVSQSGLPKTLIDMVYLRVSHINGCAYCIDSHTRDLLKESVPVEKVTLVPTWQEGGAFFDERERAALAWAETVTRVADTHVPDDAYAIARAVFGPEISARGQQHYDADPDEDQRRAIGPEVRLVREQKR